MPIIAWKDVYKTGIVALDNEHRCLIEEINRLYEAVRDKCGAEVLTDIFAMLDKYTVDHFQREERLMKEYNFPGLEEHQQRHQELAAAVQKLKDQNTDDLNQLARELLKLLRVWLMEHIVEEDQKYGSYLESRAGRFVT